MAGAMYFNIRSFLHLVGASAQKESCAINLGNEYVCFLKIEKQLWIKNQNNTQSNDKLEKKYKIKTLKRNI